MAGRYWFRPSVLSLWLIAGTACACLLLDSNNTANGASPHSKHQLEREKTRAEIHKLTSEGEKLDTEKDVVGGILRLAPLITVLVALGGLIATLWKQIGESGRQRTLDREERQKARQERFDVQFQQIVDNLGSKDGAVRAGAAASIQTFMRPEYADFHERVFLLLLGSLRFPVHDFSDKLLVRTFQQVASERLSRDPCTKTPRAGLDLSNCFLARVELINLDLAGADLAFADLHGSDLSNSSLYRARGLQIDLSGARMQGTCLEEARMNDARLVKARLHGANLVSVKLKGVDATGASFRGSRMQEANLDKAVLLGASFLGADLNNAYFRGASFDLGALRSIARGALNWRQGNWDDDIRTRLNELSDDDKER